jgi:hypothetical protein
MTIRRAIDLTIIALATLAVHLLGAAEPAAFVYQNF